MTENTLSEEDKNILKAAERVLNDEVDYFRCVPKGVANVCGNERAIENQSKVNTSRDDGFTVSDLYEVAMRLPEDQRPRTIYEHRRKCEDFPGYRRRLSWLKRLEQGGRD